MAGSIGIANLKNWGMKSILTHFLTVEQIFKGGNEVNKILGGNSHLLFDLSFWVKTSVHACMYISGGIRFCLP